MSVLAYSFVATLLIGLLLKAVMGWRVDEAAEAAGIDQAEHAEAGYDFGTFGSGGGSRSPLAHRTTTDQEVSA